MFWQNRTQHNIFMSREYSLLVINKIKCASFAGFKIRMKMRHNYKQFCAPGNNLL